MNLLQDIQSVQAPISTPLRLGLVLVTLGIALALEHLVPLRQATQSKSQRFFTNIGLATLSAIVLRFSFYPIVLYVAYKTEALGIGLLPTLGLRGIAEIVVSLILLDATLYYWHVMLHKVPVLWRFHNVHHIDLDLDTSTAFRFHLGELALSTAFRSIQIVVIGVPPFTLVLFEILVTAFAQFHHGNIRLPQKFERYLGWLIITPRLHGIHHSTIQSETDSNFGTALTLWDRVGGTYNPDVPQNTVTIGVPSYRDTSEQTLWNVLWLPFQRARPWRYPDGTVPSRPDKCGSSSSK